MPREKFLHEIATERASAYAPLPKYNPLQAGLFGLFFTTIMISLFVALGGLNAESLFWPASIVEAVGFAAPYFYVRHEARKHFEAHAKEYLALNEADEAKRPPVQA